MIPEDDFCRLTEYDAYLHKNDPAPGRPSLHSPSTERFDSAFAGSWNAGSNARNGGTTLEPEIYASRVTEAMRESWGISAQSFSARWRPIPVTMPSPIEEVQSKRDNERDLVARAIDDERAAHDRIYDLYAPAIFRLAFRMTGDNDLASDITQDTFIKAFDSLPSFRHDSSLRTWIHSIGVATILASLRATKRRQAKHSSIVVANAGTDTSPTGDALLRAHLYAAIDALAPGYRTVFVMHEIEGYSHPEIAKHLGIEVTTSQGQLFRARAKLRELLEQFRGDIKT